MVVAAAVAAQEKEDVEAVDVAVVVLPQGVEFREEAAEEEEEEEEEAAVVFLMLSTLPREEVAHR